MKAKYFGILSFFLCCAPALQAQNYASRKLAEIGECFPKNCLPDSDSIFTCNKINIGKAFVVGYNGKNEISHLGVSLFSPETKDLLNKPICNFIERMMLELLLQKSETQVRKKLQENKISLQKNQLEYGKRPFTSLNRMLNDIQTPTQFSILKDSVYTVRWQYGENDELSMSFPVLRELIFGTDKKESDENIGILLDNDCTFSVKQTEIAGNDLKALNGTDLYLHKGETFLLDKINSDTYYQRSDSMYLPAFNEAYPKESLANLFLTKQIENQLTLKIIHRMYGRFTPEFIISLNRFLCLFDREFSTYCLLYSQKPDGALRVSVVLHNHDYNYIHLLRIKTTAGQLFAANGVLQADFYTNIPQHNLKNLFIN